jgi:ribosome-associated translation inhibitor RaiA
MHWTGACGGTAIGCNHSAWHGLPYDADQTAGKGNMQIAPEITFEGSESSDAARAQILSEIERLETHNKRITGCRVKVIAPSHKHRHGIGFQVHIWLTIPPHENIVVNQSGSNDARNEYAQVAIKDAFAALRRQVDSLAA